MWGEGTINKSQAQARGISAIIGMGRCGDDWKEYGRLRLVSLGVNGFPSSRQSSASMALGVGLIGIRILDVYIPK